MKNLASFNPDQMKEYFLVTPLEVEHINVTIKDFGRLLNVLMLLLMSLLQVQKKKNKQQKTMMTYILLHQMGMMQTVNPMKNLKMIYLKRFHPDMFKKIIQNLKFWEKRDQVYKQEGLLQDLLAIWHFYPLLNHKMSIKLEKMNFGFNP